MPLTAKGLNFLSSLVECRLIEIPFILVVAIHFQETIAVNDIQVVGRADEAIMRPVTRRYQRAQTTRRCGSGGAVRGRGCGATDPTGS
jgi:hypothetical protein